MNTTALHLLHSVPGLEIRPDGQTVLSGPALAALEAVDAMVLSWADQLGAERHSYSPLLPARQLDKVEHFSSFPHQVVFPASVNQDRLEDFAADRFPSDRWSSVQGISDLNKSRRFGGGNIDGELFEFAPQ